MKFKDNLREILKAEGLTQAQPADRSDITEVTISRYINGQRLPKVSELVRIARALHTTPNRLLSFGEEGWISVRDRLPDVGAGVMVYGKKGNLEIITYGMHRADDRWWVEMLGVGGAIFEKDAITHWAPLPEPPKGGGER